MPTLSALIALDHITPSPLPRCNRLITAVYNTEHGRWAHPLRSIPHTFCCVSAQFRDRADCNPPFKTYELDTRTRGEVNFRLASGRLAKFFTGFEQSPHATQMTPTTPNGTGCNEENNGCLSGLKSGTLSYKWAHNSTYIHQRPVLNKSQKQLFDSFFFFFLMPNQFFFHQIAMIWHPKYVRPMPFSTHLQHLNAASENNRLECRRSDSRACRSHKYRIYSECLSNKRELLRQMLERHIVFTAHAPDTQCRRV